MLVFLAIVVELARTKGLHELRHVRAVRLLNRLLDGGVGSTIARCNAAMLDKTSYEWWTIANGTAVTVHTEVFLFILNFVIVGARLRVESGLL